MFMFVCYGVRVTLPHGLIVQTFCTLHCSIQFRLDRMFLFDAIQDKDWQWATKSYALLSLLEICFAASSQFHVFPRIIRLNECMYVIVHKLYETLMTTPKEELQSLQEELKSQVPEPLNNMLKDKEPCTLKGRINKQ